MNDRKKKFKGFAGLKMDLTKPAENLIGVLEDLNETIDYFYHDCGIKQSKHGTGE